MICYNEFCIHFYELDEYKYHCNLNKKPSECLCSNKFDQEFLAYPELNRDDEDENECGNSVL